MIAPGRRRPLTSTRMVCRQPRCPCTHRTCLHGVIRSIKTQGGGPAYIHLGQYRPEAGRVIDTAAGGGASAFGVDGHGRVRDAAGGAPGFVFASWIGGPRGI